MRYPSLPTDPATPVQSSAAGYQLGPEMLGLIGGKNPLAVPVADNSISRAGVALLIFVFKVLAKETKTLFSKEKRRGKAYMALKGCAK